MEKHAINGSGRDQKPPAMPDPPGDLELHLPPKKVPPEKPARIGDPPPEGIDDGEETPKRIA
jgi:hypothetical protein